MGWLIDRFGAPGVAAVILTPETVGCLIIMGQVTIGLAILAAALVELAAGAELDLLGVLDRALFWFEELRPNLRFPFCRCRDRRWGWADDFRLYPPAYGQLRH